MENVPRETSQENPSFEGFSGIKKLDLKEVPSYKVFKGETVRQQRIIIQNKHHKMTEDKLAVLIDADNVPYSNVKEMLEEIAKNGTPTIKRIYADWTKPTVAGWKNVLLENAITPIQQYSYTTGKNSSDSAMIIDAMDILYSGKLQSVVSDSLGNNNFFNEFKMFVDGQEEIKFAFSFSNIPYLRNINYV